MSERSFPIHNIKNHQILVEEWAPTASSSHAGGQWKSCSNLDDALIQFNSLNLSPFCGTTETLVLDFWWYLPWISQPRWIPRLHTSPPPSSSFLRLTSGATPVDLLAASMTAKLFDPHTCHQALVGLVPRSHVPLDAQRTNCLSNPSLITLWKKKLIKIIFKLYSLQIGEIGNFH